jgi:hypothetical protein
MNTVVLQTNDDRCQTDKVVLQTDDDGCQMKTVVLQTNNDRCQMNNAIFRADECGLEKNDTLGWSATSRNSKTSDRRPTLASITGAITVLVK